MKPWVRKFGGIWAWRCPLHPTPPGEEYATWAWRDAWSIAVARARQHAEQYHGGHVMEEGTL